MSKPVTRLALSLVMLAATLQLGVRPAMASHGAAKSAAVFQSSFTTKGIKFFGGPTLLGIMLIATAVYVLCFRSLRRAARKL